MRLNARWLVAATPMPEQGVYVFGYKEGNRTYGCRVTLKDTYTKDEVVGLMAEVLSAIGRGIPAEVHEHTYARIYAT